MSGKADAQNSKKWAKSDDLHSIEYLTEWIQDSKLKNFAIDCLRWSIGKAWKYNLLYVTFIVLAAMLPALSPVIISFRSYIPCWPSIITILSSVTTICLALSVSLRIKDLWQNYRNAAELARNECVECFMSTGKYKKYAKGNAAIIEEKERVFAANLLAIHKGFLGAWEKAYGNSEKNN